MHPIDETLVQGDCHDLRDERWRGRSKEGREMKEEVEEDEKKGEVGDGESR